MKIIRFMNIVAITLIICGFLVILAGLYARQTNASIQAQPVAYPEVTDTQPIAEGPEVKFGRPIEIRIDSLDIRNQIIDGNFNASTQQWTLTTDKVQFAAISHLPNTQEGLTFMYGHNRKEVFNRLTKIEPGALASVRTENGLIFTYRYTSSQTVRPENASVFSYKGQPKLVLQTCTGMFYQNRQLFSFELVGVDHA